MIVRQLSIVNFNLIKQVCFYSIITIQNRKIKKQYSLKKTISENLVAIFKFAIILFVLSQIMIFYHSNETFITNDNNWH